MSDDQIATPGEGRPPDPCDRVVSHSADETRALGGQIAAALQPGDNLALIGELGAGKTVLTKGIFAGLGGDAREVTSPTFVLMTPHEARLTLYHFDAYRLSGADAMQEIGAEEFFYGSGVCVIEWADRVTDALPPDRLELHMTIAGKRERAIKFIPTGTRSSILLASIHPRRTQM